MCKAKDSDACLKASGKNWAGYTCSKSTKWCTSWAKDMKRCCPNACGVTGSFSESDCKAVGGKGSCIYPNEAQPDETQCNKGEVTIEGELYYILYTIKVSYIATIDISLHYYLVTMLSIFN